MRLRLVYICAYGLTMEVGKFAGLPYAKCLQLIEKISMSKLVLSVVYASTQNIDYYSQTVSRILTLIDWFRR